MTGAPPEGSELPSTSHRYPDPRSGPWVATLSWRMIDGRPECVGVASRAVAEGVPVTSTTMRELPLARLIANDRAWLMSSWEGKVERPPGMRPSTFVKLQTVAEVYREALAAGSRSPTKAVEQRFEVPPGTAGSLVFQARRLGLLPPTSPGVGGR